MKRTLIIMAVLFSLTLASCGGGGGASTKINVTMTDFQFQPSQFTVPAGQEITLNATNNGAVVHNFVIMKLGTSAGPSFDNEDLSNVFWQVELQPGGSVNTSFTAPSEAGDYEVVCRTEGHIAAGMVAKLTVVKAE
ncbi:MAG TPA: cupredoxin domain-containing protein [Anaerolineales bacterium]|nr:cupredoxin domain-containing protein [Anaerolineales bacterium]